MIWFNSCYVEGDREFALWKAGKLIRSEDERARNHRKELEYEALQGIKSTTSQSHNKHLHTLDQKVDVFDSSSEYSYEMESVDENTPPGTADDNQRNIFTEQDLPMIYRT